MYNNYNDLYTSLYHSGIKGMKWGVRRALIGAAAGAVMSIGYNKVMGNI